MKVLNLNIVLLFIMLTSSIWADIKIKNFYPNFVHVKFVDNTILPVENRILDINTFFKQNANNSTNSQNSAVTAAIKSNWIKTFDVDFNRMIKFRENAAENLNKPIPDLNTYFTVKLDQNISVQEAIDLFSKLLYVEAVYPIPIPVEPPQVPDYTDPANTSGSYQNYLDPAPNGIDALYAWHGSGGKGKGVHIVDMEYDWNRFHADLARSGSPVSIVGPAPYFDNTFDAKDLKRWKNHGTAVLGIYGGIDNDFGMSGIANQAELSVVAQVTNILGSSVNDIAGAILRAVDELEKGDIIVLEAQIAGPNWDPDIDPQYGLMPVEWNKTIYDAIQTAVGNGIIVVEAAGNGGQNLDDNEYNTGHAPFDLNKDSGAIMVGAGKSPAWGNSAKRKHDFSNYGNTVDLQGWGDGVLTTGYGNLYDDDGENFLYTNGFSGTSSATPIVAGAVAILQSTLKQKTGAPASAATIKDILRETGTAQVGDGNIGPLPNLKMAIDQIWDDETLSPSPLVLNPPSGTYEMPIQVTINYGTGQSISNTSIRYTLDGSEPNEDSYIFIPDQGDVIYLNYGATITAKAFQYNQNNGRLYSSQSVSAQYVSSTPKVDTPIITPGEGTFSQPHQVTISTSTPGATIRYRTDGRIPSFFYPGTNYDGPITLDPGNYYITARGYKDGYYKSDAVTTGEIIVNALTLPSPTIYPGSGTFNGGVTVYIGSTVLGAIIRYTTDGTDPNENSAQFIQPLEFSETTQLKARVYLESYTPSAIVSTNYEIVQQAAAPVFSPAGGQYSGSVQVSMSTCTANGIIRYTTNGAEPTSYSNAYSEPFTLTIGQHTIKAKTFLAGTNSSETVSKDYIVFDPNTNIVADPIVSPFSSQQFTKPFPLTITCDTEGALIRYTVGFDQLPDDPLETGAGSITYTQPVLLGSVGSNIFLKVRAFKSGMTPSNIIQTGQLAVVEPLGEVDTPTINPFGGTFHNAVQVELESATPFAQIIYTVDGSDPSSWLPILPPTQKYNNTLNLFQPATLKTMGYRTFFTDSEITQAQFFFECAPPIIIPENDKHTLHVSVEMSSETLNAKIYYTTDGSDPSINSMLYDEPFELGIGTHVIKAVANKINYDNSPIVARIFTVEQEAVAPLVTINPQSQNVLDGVDLSLSVEAEGSGNLIYLWQKDGILIAGATEPILDLPNVRIGDAGNYRAIVTNSAGADTSEIAVIEVLPTAISEFDQGLIPTDYALGTNYPNPFNPTTNITFAIPRTSRVKVEIFNTLGRKIKTLMDATLNTGYHTLHWNGLNDNGQTIPTGVYFYRMQTESFTDTKKMVLVK